MIAERPHRFFPATILGGFLHVRGIPDWGPLNDGGVEYTHESFVDAILRPGTRGRTAPSRTLWLHVSLLEEARRLWEMMAAELTNPLSPDH